MPTVTKGCSFPNGNVRDSPSNKGKSRTAGGLGHFLLIGLHVILTVATSDKIF